jgi:predicted PurR-regulated permease PerM
MEPLVNKYPFYFRTAAILLLLSLCFLGLYVGRDIIMPFFLSVLFAILLRPFVVFLNKKLRFPHVIAALVAVLLFLIVIGGIVYFISWQISEFTSDWPKIKHNFTIHYEHVRAWIKERLNLSYTKQNTLIKSVKENSLSNPNHFVQETFLSFSQTLFTMILIPVYTFLILIYRGLFRQFLMKLIRHRDRGTLKDIITEVKLVVQSYIVGLLMEMGIVAVLTSAGFYFIGVSYAVLLGVITAILNLIPYIGILVAGVISILATLINSTDLSLALGVIAVNVVVQFIDNNIIIPKIVASKVKINALISIVVVIVGNAIAGVVGMFLALPLTAILKVIFDRVDELKPWGYLLGDETNRTFKWKRMKFPNLNMGNEEPKDEPIQKDKPPIHYNFKRKKRKKPNLPNPQNRQTNGE